VLSGLNPAEPVDNWRVMSPTSYQAAPPRVSMIADGCGAVKRCRRGENFVSIERSRNVRRGRKIGRAWNIKELTAYQELYGVLVNGESRSEEEFTSPMP
jgi:hypothetical protein